MVSKVTPDEMNSKRHDENKKGNNNNDTNNRGTQIAMAKPAKEKKMKKTDRKRHRQNASENTV